MSKNKAKNKKITEKETLLQNAEIVLDMIEEGKSYDNICERFDVHHKYVSWFVAQSDYSARARQSQKNSAQRYANLALNSLLAIKTGDDKADITRQRELAHHYRWLAKVKAPREFNENRVDADDLVAKLLAPTIILKKE
jgi:hypothetical protein